MDGKPHHDDMVKWPWNLAGINDRDIYPLGGIDVYSLASPASSQKVAYWPYEVCDEFPSDARLLMGP